MHIIKNRAEIVLLVVLTTALILAACQPSNEPEIDIDAQKTSFAITAQAQSSMTAAAQEAAQPTATNTPEAPQATPTATPSLEGEATEAGEPTEGATTPTTGASPTATIPPQGGNDAAAWRANDPPDNTDIKAGEDFSVTWTLENTGTSTWTTNYYIQFSSGEQMGAEEKVYLPYPVPPGKNVQIAVNFTAPETEGEKKSNWVLNNANDDSFYAFYVIIDVVKESSPPAQPTNTPEPTATPDGS